MCAWALIDQHSVQFGPTANTHFQGQSSAHDVWTGGGWGGLSPELLLHRVCNVGPCAMCYHTSDCSSCTVRMYTANYFTWRQTLLMQYKVSQVCTSYWNRHGPTKNTPDSWQVVVAKKKKKKQERRLKKSAIATAEGLTQSMQRHAQGSQRLAMACHT